MPAPMQIDMIPRLCRQTDILYYSQLRGDCKYIRYETGAAYMKQVLCEFLLILVFYVLLYQLKLILSYADNAFYFLT